MIVVAAKIDVAQEPQRIEAVELLARERGLPYLAISAVTGTGLSDLVSEIADRVLVKQEVFPA